MTTHAHQPSAQHHASSWAHTALLSAAHALNGLLTDSVSIARIERVSEMIAQSLIHSHGDAGSSGGGWAGKVMICGNGGSSADAMHFAEELTGRFRGERPAIPAIACTDAGHITCVSNDYGFEHVFSRWVAALGRPGDVLIVLSTSGNSRNVIEAVKAAKDKHMETIALLGKGGGQLNGMCDEEWIVPGEHADRIQEIHMIILHLIIEGIERTLYPHLYK